mgnify:CR=1 FL=1
MPHSSCSGSDAFRFGVARFGLDLTRLEANEEVVVEVWRLPDE